RAAEGLQALLERSPNHAQARDLAAVAALRSGETDAAAELVAGTLRRNPLDAWARHLASRLGRAEAIDHATIVLDVALEYLSVGEDETAAELLEAAARMPLVRGRTNIAPLAWLHRADLELRRGDSAAAERALERARELDRTWCFPSAADNDALE